ncbi:phage holin family protein [Verrucomicrobium spinosum]|nr:phage holin family protein [Verrucomicrobium spinosum]
MQPPLNSDPEKTSAGVTGTLRRLLAAAVMYLEARFRLACMEGGGAFKLLAAVIVAALTSLLFASIAYVLLMFAVVGWVAAHWWQGELAPAAAVVAAAHLLGAAALALWAIRTLSTSSKTLFHATRHEFQQDKLWLTSSQPNSRN